MINDAADVLFIPQSVHVLYTSVSVQIRTRGASRAESLRTETLCRGVSGHKYTDPEIEAQAGTRESFLTDMFLFFIESLSPPLRLVLGRSDGERGQRDPPGDV